MDSFEILQWFSFITNVILVLVPQAYQLESELIEDWKDFSFVLIGFYLP